MEEPALPSLRRALVAWFRRGHRDLPWRRTRDPYAVWISEIMLQQTRVETVAPRFDRWMARFPSPVALAAAPLDDVLAEWSGLGYYARARNLHAAAREVVERWGGALPDEPAAIRALPGVGRYTAGAIASIAFGRPEPIVDGNVIRVLSRLFRLDGDPRSAAGQARLWALAGALARGDDPGALNQSLMELGAVICAPKRPACLACPVADRCGARRDGVPERFPAPSAKTKVQALRQVAVALVRRGRVLLARRPPSGLWGGLLELPTGDLLDGEPLDAAAKRVTRERTGLAITAPSPTGEFTHVLSHRRITFHGFRAASLGGAVRLSGYDDHRWVALDPLPVAGELGLSRATMRLLDAARAGAT